MGQLAVFELVAKANPLTTPNPFENVVPDTPLRSSSPSRWEVEQMLEEMDHKSPRARTHRVRRDQYHPFIDRHCVPAARRSISMPFFPLQIRHSKGQLICPLGLITESRRFRHAHSTVSPHPNYPS